MKRKLLLTNEQINSGIDAIAAKINEREGELLCVCVLKGAFMFFSELVKRLKGDIRVDFVRVASYDGDKSGELRLLLDISEDVAGKDILIVEDIVDSGATASYLRKLFLLRGANSVKVACLLDKPLGRKVEISPDYYALRLDDDSFVVGFGLDYDQQFRCLDHIEEVRFD